MSGADRYFITQKLIKLGWKEIQVDIDGQKRDRLVPPDDLWKSKPEYFYVYEAKDLQDLLGKETDSIEDE